MGIKHENNIIIKTNNKIDNVIYKGIIKNRNKSSKNKYINQLFKIKPSHDFVLEFIKLFIPCGFNEHYTFTKEKLINNNIIEKMESYYYVKEFKKIYMPCKYNKYFKKLNEKKVITILRQILKLYNYKIYSKEKYENKTKKLFYNIKKTKKYVNIDKNLIVNFD